MILTKARLVGDVRIQRFICQVVTKRVPERVSKHALCAFGSDIGWSITTDGTTTNTSRPVLATSTMASPFYSDSFSADIPVIHDLGHYRQVEIVMPQTIVG